jgi:hypothetical protein
MPFIAKPRHGVTWRAQVRHKQGTVLVAVAHSCSAGQEIPHLSRNRDVHCCVHKRREQNGFRLVLAAHPVFAGHEVAPARKADNLTAICEPNV